MFGAVSQHWKPCSPMMLETVSIIELSSYHNWCMRTSRTYENLLQGIFKRLVTKFRSYQKRTNKEIQRLLCCKACITFVLINYLFLFTIALIHFLGVTIYINPKLIIWNTTSDTNPRLFLPSFNVNTCCNRPHTITCVI